MQLRKSVVQRVNHEMKKKQSEYDLKGTLLRFLILNAFECFATYTIRKKFSVNSFVTASKPASNLINITMQIYSHN